MNFLKKNGAGLLLCLAISIPAWFLGKSFPVIGGPVFAKNRLPQELTIPPKKYCRPLLFFLDSE